MLRTLTLVLLLASAAPAAAAGLHPVPTRAIIGHPYAGDSASARILFINVHDRPVEVIWIGFDGAEHLYATLDEGQEWLQPTYVAHRWLVREANGAPLTAFIATRSDRHGSAQVALIR